MENLTHSLSKKSYSGNGFGMTSHHKSVYDDVFGGAPKFGVPTLAPRFEDYTEIFGGFHSSRGSSVPILDLPVVEEVELDFDVRSSRLDYSEVFGGFEGLDFAVSVEDLARKSNGPDDSSDDAWYDVWFRFSTLYLLASLSTCFSACPTLSCGFFVSSLNWPVFPVYIYVCISTSLFTGNSKMINTYQFLRFYLFLLIFNFSFFFFSPKKFPDNFHFGLER